MKFQEPLPPKLFLRFFNWFCHPQLKSYIEGDLMELYDERFKKFGKRKADIKFIIDVVLLFRPGIIKPSNQYQSVNNFAMYKSYLKIALRNLWSNKAFSFINISGLAAGMATCVLIMLYVSDEMSYDKHHTDGQRVFRISSEVNGEKWVAAPAPMAEGLKNDFPEVEAVTRLLRFPGAEKMLLKDEHGKKQFFENNAYYVDSTFFNIFTYELKFGDRKTALNEPNSIIISETVATKFFGNENPVGSLLNVGLSFGNFNYTIKGVFRNGKNKSHIPANLLLSMNNGDVGGWVKQQTNWAANSIFHTYVKLKPKTDSEIFESKLADFLNRNGGADFKAAGFTKTLFIQPLEDIYLYSDYGFEVAPNGNVRYLYVFTSIAAFLLLIACINFMNLSTARSEKRAREVGLRKVSGANKSILVGQFMCESLFMSALALIISILFIQFFIPVFNQLTNKELSLLQLPNAYVWLAFLMIATGLLSGSYPAFYLSSFRPITVLKGKLVNTVSAISIRKGLVVFQFTISIVLILGAALISQQMEFLSNESLGFSKNQKIILPIQTSEAEVNTNAFKNELLNNSQVVAVAKGGSYPGIESVTSMLFYGERKNVQDHVDVQTTFVDADYLKTLNIKLLTGRDFAKEFTHDENAVILNESALNHFGYTLDNAIGKKIYYEFQNETHAMNIIGVVKDYHYQSLHQKIKPLALTIAPFFSGPNRYLIVDVKAKNYAELITTFQKKWSKINPGSPFTYSFLDQDFQKNYDKETRTSKLLQYFTIIAIVIACLGLFGLTTFTAEQRIKEIGVRKVLGASVLQIATLLSKDFMKLVLVSIVLAIPLGYYFMSRWLENFAYHVDIKWWLFIIAGIGTSVIALLTMSFQAIKSALANPVKSLRSE